MLLAIDVGNTNMVFGIFSGERLTGTFRLKTDPSRTADELGLLIQGGCRRFGLEAGAVEDVIIDSVVPPVMHALREALSSYLGKVPLVVDEDIDPAFPYSVETEEHLGADRSVACVAAIEKYGAPLVVVDLGTATTVDGVSRQGTYLGGCITAGAGISIEALFQKASLLPRVDLARPEKVLHGTTVGQVQAGAVLGYIGAMERLIRQAKEEMGEPEAKVIATGGLAPLIAGSTDLVDVVDSALILDGLRILYQRRARQG